jgi:hypothetical protein
MKRVRDKVQEEKKKKEEEALTIRDLFDDMHTEISASLATRPMVRYSEALHMNHEAKARLLRWLYYRDLVAPVKALLGRDPEGQEAVRPGMDLDRFVVAAFYRAEVMKRISIATDTIHAFLTITSVLSKRTPQFFNPRLYEIHVADPNNRVLMSFQSLKQGLNQGLTDEDMDEIQQQNLIGIMNISYVAEDFEDRKSVRALQEILDYGLTLFSKKNPKVRECLMDFLFDVFYDVSGDSVLSLPTLYITRTPTLRFIGAQTTLATISRFRITEPTMTQDNPPELLPAGSLISPERYFSLAPAPIVK